jgi:hypothetical protein
VRRRQSVIYLPGAMVMLLCAGVWEDFSREECMSVVSFHDCDVRRLVSGRYKGAKAY